MEPSAMSRRNERGAGFMADGYAVSAEDPVWPRDSGPGVTNALTAVGQSWADSSMLQFPEADSRIHGKGWGALHEIAEASRHRSYDLAFVESLPS